VVARRSSGSGGVGVARAEDGSWGKTTVAASRRAAHGICREPESGARRLGQTIGGFARREEASAGSGKAAAMQGRACGPVQDGAKAVGVAHMAGQSGGCARQRNRGGGREVDERGLQWNFSKNTRTPL
jgi:hypothetical protein